MSAYSEGTVNLTVGTATVIGNNTSFNTYAAANYIFRLANESVFYTIQTVNTATNLTLTSNYSNSSYSNGDSLTGLSYSIITDYTANYNLPEMSPNDSGITYIYTKAMRLIDAAISDYALSFIVTKQTSASVTGDAAELIDGDVNTATYTQGVTFV